MMQENFLVFFSDFAVDCIKPDTSKAKVIFEVPDEMAFGDSSINSEPKIIGMWSNFADINDLDTLVVDGIGYVVRYIKKIEDGKICEIGLRTL